MNVLQKLICNEIMARAISAPNALFPISTIAESLPVRCKTGDIAVCLAYLLEHNNLVMQGSDAVSFAPDICSIYMFFGKRHDPFALEIVEKKRKQKHAQTITLDEKLRFLRMMKSSVHTSKQAAVVYAIKQDIIQNSQAGGSHVG